METWVACVQWQQISECYKMVNYIGGQCKNTRDILIANKDQNHKYATFGHSECNGVMDN